VIVDTSALIAVLLTEPDAAPIETALDRASSIRMSAATWVELSSVAAGRGLLEEVDDLLRDLSVEIVAFDAEQAAIAREAQQRFGSGGDRLNLGDTFAYALAKHTGEPLLFKGWDFARTDVIPALSGS
jgi:ribonuclease VapC